MGVLHKQEKWNKIKNVGSYKAPLAPWQVKKGRLPEGSHPLGPAPPLRDRAVSRPSFEALFRVESFRASKEGRDTFVLSLKKTKGGAGMKLGSLGIALMKVLSIEHTIIVDGKNGKWRTKIPTCIEQIWKTTKPLTEEEYEQIQIKKKRMYEENKEKSLKFYKKLKRELERDLRRKKRAVEKISEVIEEIDRKLKQDPTNTQLMRKLQYWANRLYIRQKKVEYLEQELQKFERFLKAFQSFSPTEFPPDEDVGRSKGTPPRRWAEIEEYSDTEGYSIHYLNEI